VSMLQLTFTNNRKKEDFGKSENLIFKKVATENINMLMIAGVICAFGDVVVIAVGKK
jgi:hypothetical protein